MNSSRLPPRDARHLSELNSKQTSNPILILGLSLWSNASKQVVTASCAVISRRGDGSWDISLTSARILSNLYCSGVGIICFGDIAWPPMMNATHDRVWKWSSTNHNTWRKSTNLAAILTRLFFTRVFQFFGKYPILGVITCALSSSMSYPKQLRTFKWLAFIGVHSFSLYLLKAIYCKVQSCQLSKLRISNMGVCIGGTLTYLKLGVKNQKKHQHSWRNVTCNLGIRNLLLVLLLVIILFWRSFDW